MNEQRKPKEDWELQMELNRIRFEHQMRMETIRMWSALVFFFFVMAWIFVALIYR